MTKEERRVYDEIQVTHGKWWVPAQWFSALAARSRKESRIKDDVLLQALLDVSKLSYKFGCKNILKFISTILSQSLSPPPLVFCLFSTK